jgi:Ca2+/H+ antiporter
MMKSIVWANAVAWGLLFLNNLALLVRALLDHKSPELAAIALFAIPLLAFLIPIWFRHHKKDGDAAVAAALLLIMWVPAAVYCIQFWSPDQDG